MLPRSVIPPLLSLAMLLVLGFSLGQAGSKTGQLEEELRAVLEPGGVVLVTSRFDVAGEDLDPELARVMADSAEDAFSSLPRRFVEPDLRVRLNVSAPDTEGECPQRPWSILALGKGYVTLRYDPDWSPSTLRRILAHEFAHVYHFASLKRLGYSGRGGDEILIEGYATWLAREAWLSGLGFESFEAAVASYLAQGDHVDMVNYYEADLAELAADEAGCIALRDRVYTQWAGFVDFLVNRFGHEKVMAASGQVRPFRYQPDGNRSYLPLDYQAVFGMSLEELQRAWLDVLAAGASGN
jgi:hypothetical protein